MRKFLENFSVFLVVLLLCAIIVMIIKYNMIEDENEPDTIGYSVSKNKSVSKKEKTTNYLKNLEGYEDVDVKVDARQENSINTVAVKSEIGATALDSAVDDKEKQAYISNLTEYEKKKNNVTQKTKVQPKILKPKKLEHEKVEDTIGTAIENALK